MASWLNFLKVRTPSLDVTISGDQANETTVVDEYGNYVTVSTDEIKIEGESNYERRLEEIKNQPVKVFQYKVSKDGDLVELSSAQERPENDFLDTPYFGRNIEEGIDLMAYTFKYYKEKSIKKRKRREYGPLETDFYVSTPVFVEKRTNLFSELFF